MQKRFETGLVVGKFYPPHRGHKHVIDTAASQVEKLTVMVCDKPGETIPAQQRAEWLREIHPNAHVTVIPDTLGDDDTAGWAAHTIEWLGHAPKAVFSSEDYGAGYARLMGAEHVMVDKPRQKFPTSGTAVRANPFSQWEFLEPCVRAHFAKRICVLGAESTGTTTLARALADHYKTVWVPEYGRVFSEGKLGANAHEWATREFTHIAGQQARMEDWLARSANRVVICDTDPFATTVWHERYMGGQSRPVREIADARRYDLYILTGDEIPFVQDGTRDGEHIRHWMHGRFEEALKETGRPYAVVRGSHQQRLAAATSLIDNVLASEKINAKRADAMAAATRA